MIQNLKIPYKFKFAKIGTFILCRQTFIKDFNKSHNQFYSKMTTVKIGTHNGAFHCDEVLACYMLKLLPRYKDAVIVRSRDLAVLDTCDIVVDVGYKYDPDTHRYDHHMREFKETMSSVLKNPNYESQIKLSSAGLIYCHFGKEIIKQILPDIDDESLECVFKKMYDIFIKEVDALDNGIPMFDGEPLYRIATNLGARVGNLNPKWNRSDQIPDEQFQKALPLAGEEFVSFVTDIYHTWLPAREIIRDAITKRFEIDPSGEIICLSTSAPWKEHLFVLEQELNITEPIKYVLFKDGSYRIQGVPLQSGSFVCRLFLPEEWAGLRDEELDKVVGIEGCVFVHSVRFIGGHKTMEGALTMARKALEIGKSTAE